MRYTQEHFSSDIDGDRTWRFREISDLKSLVKFNEPRRSASLLRALVAICYAHWEGYVRFSARKYLEYIAVRKLQFSELDRQFLRNYFLPRLSALTNSKTSLSERCKLVDDILSASDQRFSKINKDLISTKSNLNSDVLRDICLVCGIDYRLFEAKAHFIDVFLLKRRNEIAHGEDTFVGVTDIEQLVEETYAIIRAFGNALENRIYEESYKIDSKIG